MSKRARDGGVVFFFDVIYWAPPAPVLCPCGARGSAANRLLARPPLPLGGHAGCEASQGGSEPAHPPQLSSSEGLDSDSENPTRSQLCKSGLTGGCETPASEAHHTAQLPSSTLTGACEAHASERPHNGPTTAMHTQTREASHVFGRHASLIPLRPRQLHPSLRPRPAAPSAFSSLP